MAVAVAARRRWPAWKLGDSAAAAWSHWQQHRGGKLGGSTEAVVAAAAATAWWQHGGGGNSGGGSGGGGQRIGSAMPVGTATVAAAITVMPPSTATVAMKTPAVTAMAGP